MDEAALHRLVGGPHIMGRQLRRLAEVAQLPNVTFQVLPFVAGEHGGMVGSFTILRFPEEEDRGVVHLEPRSGELYLDRPDQVGAYERLFRSLQAIAMTPDASVALVSELARRLSC